MMRATFILSCLLLALVRISWADGGAIQFQGDTGTFHVTVFTRPPILHAGLIDVTLLLQERSDLNPLLDAKVRFDLAAQDGAARQPALWMPPACAMNKTADLSDIPAKLGHGENRLLYGNVVQIPNSGHWQLRARIQRGAESAEIETLLNVAPAPLPPLAYWHLFLLVPAGILGFFLHQMAQARKTHPSPAGARSGRLR